MINVSDYSPCISRRPAWAEKTSLQFDAILHTWTAPTTAASIKTDDGEFDNESVELVQMDDLYVGPEGVVIDRGPVRIYVCDTTLDVGNARTLATAILECCDRIKGVTDECCDRIKGVTDES